MASRPPGSSAPPSGRGSRPRRRPAASSSRRRRLEQRQRRVRRRARHLRGQTEALVQSRQSSWPSSSCPSSSPRAAMTATGPADVRAKTVSTLGDLRRNAALVERDVGERRRPRFPARHSPAAPRPRRPREPPARASVRQTRPRLERHRQDVLDLLALALDRQRAAPKKLQGELPENLCPIRTGRREIRGRVDGGERSQRARAARQRVQKIPGPECDPGRGPLTTTGKRTHHRPARRLRRGASVTRTDHMHRSVRPPERVHGPPRAKEGVPVNAPPTRTRPWRPRTSRGAREGSPEMLFEREAARCSALAAASTIARSVVS